ncbi:MAG: CehA/McbA family metallohydrolase [Candidatus Bathyarchaeota archaeon]|nr:CehA/McbA family metallohydrolase [Candidatus Bathyarchaeota archaeon]
MIRADLHIHTTYSGDSTVTPKALVEKLVAHNFIKVAAVTDHETVKGLNETRKLAATYPDILIIPGVEISTPEGDLLVLGTKETPPQPWTAQRVLDFAKDNGFVSIVAHPYREYGMGDAARKYKVNAIEVLNGESTPYANKLARDLAKTMELPGIAGSDAHNPSEPLTVHTEIQADLNVDEILKAIKKGLVSAHSVTRSIHF